MADIDINEYYIFSIRWFILYFAMQIFELSIATKVFSDSLFLPSLKLKQLILCKYFSWEIWGYLTNQLQVKIFFFFYIIKKSLLYIKLSNQQLHVKRLLTCFMDVYGSLMLESFMDVYGSQCVEVYLLMRTYEVPSDMLNVICNILPS